MAFSHTLRRNRRWLMAASILGASFLSHTDLETLQAQTSATPIGYSKPGCNTCAPQYHCPPNITMPRSGSPDYADPGTPVAPGTTQTPGIPNDNQVAPIAPMPAMAATPNYDSVASSPTSLMPNMIGDMSGGGCGGLFVGGALVASITHPTYACSRLNIAENNSAIVRDRVYATYRHFHNATDLDIFSYSPQGRSNVLDIDRLTLGVEHRLSDVTSIEVRLPINYQFGSDARFEQGAPNYPNSAPPYDGSNNNLSQVLYDRDLELGNVSVILKHLLYDDGYMYWSGGLGVNTPTAPNVNISGSIHDATFPVYNLDGTLNTVVPTDVDFAGTYKNQTVNLQPFLAFACAPDDEWFMQGFLQVDVPVNKSNGNLYVAGAVDGNTPFLRDVSGDLGQQVLLRTNLGIGRWLYQDSRLDRRIGLVFETHYTTTLSDADIASVAPIDVGPGFDPITLQLGNTGNRVDVVNMVLGVPMIFGDTAIYNGFGVPVSGNTMDNRGFDFEYSLTVEKRF